VEKGDKISLLRKLTGGAGVFLYGIIMLSALLNLSRALSQLSTGDFMLSALREPLSNYLAALPTWVVFGLLAWQALKPELKSLRRR
jgi:hypothetical protein